MQSKCELFSAPEVPKKGEEGKVKAAFLLPLSTFSLLHPKMEPFFFAMSRRKEVREKATGGEFAPLLSLSLSLPLVEIRRERERELREGERR